MQSKIKDRSRFMLTRMRIEKLFDIFDYDIEFKTEGVTILTGPNGYGKTTVLKIIDALASRNSLFFMQLLFKKLVLELSDGDEIMLEKSDNGAVEFTVNQSKTLRWNTKSLIKSLDKVAERLPFFSQLSENEWLDRRTDEILNRDTLLQRILIDFPEKIEGLPISDWANSFKTPTVYFIREQRLLRPISRNRTNSKQRRFSLGLNSEEEINAFSNTIEEYAKELRENIKETLAKSSQITQQLDSSFPRRLFDQSSDITEEDFTRRFKQVKEIQKSLSEHGISNIQEDTHPTYKTENAKALHVYIDDSERKLAVFSELLDKLKAFTDTLNERRFTFKRIAISKEDGFKFTTNEGIPLVLGDLSSGEQQEVVLLYELLFKVQSGTLVLIDEPELSLHIVWQKEFLADIFKIIELQKINIVIATHSPQIINNRWDLTIDLEDLRNAKIPK
jgi:predicted ATP-binding protein involved in virulence